MKYIWHDNNSITKEIEFTGNGKNSILEAVISIPANVNNEQLRNLDQQLVDGGFNLSYDTKDNKPILRVSGIRHPNDLVKLLQQNKLVAGNYSIEETKKTNKSLWQRIRDNSLVLSAVFYMLGNIVTMISGYFRRDADEFRTGFSFSIGDGSVLLFGKRNAKEKHHAVMQNFGDFLKQHGIEPSFGSNFAPSAVKEPKTAWGAIKSFMHDKVIAIKSVSEIIAGISFAKAGFNQENAYKKIAGTALVTGFGLGLAIPEKSDSQIRDDLGVDTPEQAEEKYAQLPWRSKAKYAIQKQPLILSGGFAAINNLSTIAGAFDEKKHARNLRKIEAELGVDSDNNRLSTKNSQYDISIVGFTQTKKIAETAYSRYERLQTEYNAASPAQRKLLAPELAEAHKQVETLKQKRKNIIEGRHGLKGDKFWIFNLFQGLFFLVANTLYAMSSKTGGASEQELADRFFSSVATEILNTKDNTAKIRILNLAAQYAGTIEELDYTTGEARAIIQQKVASLQQHPLVHKATNIAQEQQHNAQHIAAKQQNNGNIAGKTEQAENKTSNLPSKNKQQLEQHIANIAHAKGKAADNFADRLKVTHKHDSHQSRYESSKHIGDVAVTPAA